MSGIHKFRSPGKKQIPPTGGKENQKRGDQNAPPTGKGESKRKTKRGKEKKDREERAYAPRCFEGCSCTKNGKSGGDLLGSL